MEGFNKSLHDFTTNIKSKSKSKENKKLINKKHKKKNNSSNVFEIEKDKIKENILKELISCTGLPPKTSKNLKNKRKPNFEKGRSLKKFINKSTSVGRNCRKGSKSFNLSCNTNSSKKKAKKKPSKLMKKNLKRNFNSFVDESNSFQEIWKPHTGKVANRKFYNKFSKMGQILMKARKRKKSYSFLENGVKNKRDSNFFPIIF